MLNNNNSHKSSCTFAEEVVSHLYGEASGKEKAEFETHLKHCSMCADEISGLGFVRSALTEWRNDEVFAMEMPRLENPAVKTTAPLVSATSPSLLDKLRELFAGFSHWKTAAAAFAVLLVGFLLVVQFIGSSEKNEVASNKIENSKEQIQPSLEQASSSQQSASNESGEHSLISDDKPTPPETTVTKNAPSNSAADSPKRKAAAVKSYDSAPQTAVNKDERKNRVEKIQNRDIPSLSNYEEEKDNSLRLADLLAEIDTK